MCNYYLYYFILHVMSNILSCILIDCPWLHPRISATSSYNIIFYSREYGLEVGKIDKILGQNQMISY